MFPTGANCVRKNPRSVGGLELRIDQDASISLLVPLLLVNDGR